MNASYLLKTLKNITQKDDLDFEYVKSGFKKLDYTTGGFKKKEITPVSILDFTQNGQHAGCEDLLVKVEEIKPKINIFGHIHEGYGDIIINNTRFINASVLNEQYALVNQPIVFEL